MEDNKVIMSLEKYTELIIENNNLKRTLNEYKIKIFNEVCEKINDSLIYKLDKTKTIELLEEKNQNKVVSMLGIYSWSFENIARNNYYILTEEEVKNLAVEEIKKIANNHLNEILEEEKGA